MKIYATENQNLNKIARISIVMIYYLNGNK